MKLEGIKLEREIDISIVTYNSKKWIESFFNSLMNQSFDNKLINLYITDNSSTDNTFDILNEYKNMYEQEFGTINLYLENNLGFGHGHNNNFSKSNSKFILVTNIDLEFDKDAITELFNFAKNDSLDTASWEMRQKPYEHPKYYNPVSLETNWSSSACVLFRKTAIEKVSGYEKRIFMYGEDVELSYRLRDNGYKLKYYPKAVCWHYTYEEINEVKPIQFTGSTLANMYIRLRYGTLLEILLGYFMYIGLLFLPKQFNNQRKDLAFNFLKLLKNTLYYLKSRKKSDIKFNFYGFDYELTRDGSFYEYKENKNKLVPLVSVIIRTCCNRVDYLKEALNSVLNQTYTNIEIIIIEDGTNYVGEYVTSLNNEKIKYTSIDKAGRCVAGNVGLANASGEYLVFLDEDDLFFSDHIEVLVDEILNSNDILAVYSNAFEVSTELISSNPLSYIEHEFNLIYKESFSRELMWHKNYITIQSILFSRSLYEKYGGFDLELDNLEDWNLWTRYSLDNDFKYIPKTTSLYRVPYNNDISSSRQKELDSYYEKALLKQKGLKINTNVYEFVNTTNNLVENSLISSYRGNIIIRVLKKLVSQRIYMFIRKLYYKFK